MKKYLQFFIIILFYRCSLDESKSLRRSELYKEFDELVNRRKPYSELRADGIYFSKNVRYDIEGIFVINNTFKPLLFKKNGFVYIFNPSVNNDKSYYLNRIIHNEIRNYNWGAYEINDKIITAIIPQVFYKRGLVSKYILCKYEGILIGTDSITNWRIIPPFPTNFDKELNEGSMLEMYQKPRCYSFFKNEIPLSVDTSGAWFNKFINSKKP